MTNGMNTDDFKKVSELIGRASVEQLYVLQHFLGAIIQDKINVAALDSGLVEKPTEEGKK